MSIFRDRKNWDPCDHAALVIVVVLAAMGIGLIAIAVHEAGWI